MSELPKFEYEKLADRIQAEIESGKLPKGARLPGEREMREVYGVGIGTARRAVRELRERGLVYTLGTKGTFVIARPGEPDERP
ncbi:winged helix-turn-helix domain-containing protein [Streptomyces sp. URMC 125]|uniref:winged helix-turn-helix domain-containing protein n=1 Tax=Streptomyces sp. URMC 125 TaxID=3423419 RepID=UPI003F1B5E40